MSRSLPPGVPSRPVVEMLGGVPATRPSGGDAPAGGFTTMDGEEYYRIRAYHRMPPFLMSVAGDTDIWMFVSSAGGLAAGRGDPEGSLFPYETVDKLHDGHHHSGPITLVRVPRGTGDELLWQPFSERAAEQFRLERNLYKNVAGNRLVFEEINHDLEIAFRYRWSGSDRFGLVRTATLLSRRSEAVTVSILDGLRNLLPHGARLALQQQASCLVDAYKRADCDPETRLGVFSLTAKILDRPEAAEELRASSVWCHGLGEFDVHLSIDAVAAFRRGEPIAAEGVLTGRRGNYLVGSSVELRPGAPAKWHVVADVGRSHIDLAALRARITQGGDLDREIEQSLRGAGENLRRIVGSADGLQLTAHVEATAHHFANVLFNSMRGGIFAANYDISVTDLGEFIRTRNRSVAKRHDALLRSLSTPIRLEDLLSAAEASADPDLQRLSHEYLPLYFGRRHGDPSRPWNRFAIRVRNGDGSRALHYEGNWRDIFQNWEALSLSFPGFLPSIIAKFVNASTVDGFNPYRITRDGVDWETVDPDDPWSHIGYWGDHQIVYLLRLLEALARFSPGALEDLLDRAIFCYADVPYRLAPYQRILENPRATIVYDTDLASRIEERVGALGTDGKLLTAPDGSVYHVNLLEKLVVPALSKLSNLVPDAGIWMNTQRPEWNDANNALVGRGVSVVTLCHLRRYLSFLERLLSARRGATTSMSSEVVTWLRRVRSVLSENRSLLGSERGPERDRRHLLDGVGEAFSDYRRSVYAEGFRGREELGVGQIVALCRDAIEHLDHAIRANRREDGLYHSYNLLEIAGDGGALAVRPLYEMLEGQVAALSSGVLEAPEALRLLSSLFDSALYREDQASFLLYPDRNLPSFLERNVVPIEKMRAVPLLRKLLDEGDTSILAQDAFGVYRFHADFSHEHDLRSALDRLARVERWSEPVTRDRDAVLELFEEVFDHRSFTGRSGTMYGYEGLGCIYWHMVAKLLLAVQEIALRAASEGRPAGVRRDLAETYYRIRRGLGYEKTAAEYGAFPTDPYSHTPSHAGAQQPGMTGQVKEEILTRFGELGVVVEGGIVTFRPVLLRRAEFLSEVGTYRYHDLKDKPRSIEIPAGSLAFSLCQVPVVYELTDAEAWVRVTDEDGASASESGSDLDARVSRALLERRGGVTRIEVGVAEGLLYRD